MARLQELARVFHPAALLAELGVWALQALTIPPSRTGSTLATDDPGPLRRSHTRPPSSFQCLCSPRSWHPDPMERQAGD